MSMIEEECESLGENSRAGSVSGASKSGLTVQEHRGFEHELKFEVQMYKVREQEYVLDFQRIQGDLFIAMDMCGRLISELRS